MNLIAFVLCTSALFVGGVVGIDVSLGYISEKYPKPVRRIPTHRRP